jgi:hypothetical protein
MKASSKKTLDMAGARFTRFLVMETAGSDKHGNAKWLCSCDCGNKKVVLGQSLRSGMTQSCGCLNREINAKRSTTHGMAHTSDYKSWHAMIQRCTNPNNHKWQRYGGRGISICNRWMSFENFVDDMGHRPKGMTIDRIDNDGNYEPANCRWATQAQQSINKSSNVFLVIHGKAVTLTYAARAAGISPACLRYRLKKGWSMEIAITAPPHSVNRSKNVK